MLEISWVCLREVAKSLWEVSWESGFKGRAKMVAGILYKKE